MAQATHGIDAFDDVLERHRLVVVGIERDCVRQDGVNWEMVISTARQVVVSAAMVASALAAMPAMVSSVR